MVASPDDVHRSSGDDGLDDEIGGHLRLLAQRFEAKGLPPDEARRAARGVFGGVEQLRERLRDQQSFPWFDALRQDLRYALRAIFRAPIVSLAVVITFALGIGANVAIFSLVNSVLLRPLPYSSPARIVAVEPFWKDRGLTTPWSSAADYYDWRAQNHTLEAMAYHAGGEFRLTVEGVPAFGFAQLAPPTSFRVFGVAPSAGRFWTEQENRASVAVVSHDWAVAHFGEARKAIGREIRIVDPPEIVGVAPAGFKYPASTDVWIPAGVVPENPNRSGHNYWVIGRLKAGVTLADARVELRAIGDRLGQQYPESRNKTVALTPLREKLTGDTRTTLWLLLGTVAGVLLIACVNVANLQLVRAAARGREIAVRCAIGAGPGRVVRQVLTIRRGRDFSADDEYGRPQVAIVNERLARDAFGTGNPIGRTIRTRTTPESGNGMQIVGVVADAREVSPDATASPALYLPYLQHPGLGSQLQLLAHTSIDPETLAPSIRETARALNPEVPVRFATMDEAFVKALAYPRFVGIYGVLSFLVAERTPEIGVRMALGALRRDIFSHTIGTSMRLVAGGLVAGLLATLAVVRVLQTVLYGVSPRDPLTIAAVAALFVVTAFLASSIPALRARRSARGAKTGLGKVQRAKLKVKSVNRTLVAAAFVLLIGVRVVAQRPVPTVDQILDKYIEAIGGKLAFDTLTSRVMIGSFEVAARGLTVLLEVYAKPPDIRVEIMGFGEASQGFNGEVGWSMNVNDNGLRELMGSPLARFKRQSLFNREVKIREQYDRLTAAGKARVGEREAYVLEGVVASVGTEKLFFDVQTGLLVRQTAGPRDRLPGLS